MSAAKQIQALVKDRELSNLSKKVLVAMGAPKTASPTLIKSFLNSANDVISKEYTRVYLKQGLEALLHVFIPWLKETKQKNSKFFDEYLSVLKKQHLVQTCGFVYDGKSEPKYKGYANGWQVHDHFSYQPQPGCLRTNSIQVVSSYYYDRNGKLQRRKKIELVQVPPPEKIASYLRETAAYAERILTENLSDRAFKKVLAGFVHSFFWAHPFDAVNKSICLAQVNMYLMRVGYPLIEHGMLDLFAYQNEKSVNVEIFSKLLNELRIEPA